jgi:tetratricopeptide (TPR) repeat protein
MQANVYEALKQRYLPALALRPNDAGLLVKIARQHAHRMNDLTDPVAKLAAGREALAHAERAVQAEPGRGEAHLAVAICLGKLTPLLGTREKIEASRRLREAAETAVKLDPRSDYAWHLLGRWHQALAGMSGLVKGIVRVVYGGLPPASNEESVRCLEKAMALGPDRLLHAEPVDDRQHSGEGRVDEAHLAVGGGPEVGRGPREQLGVRDHLGVDLEPDDGFVVHFWKGLTTKHTKYTKLRNRA